MNANHNLFEFNPELEACIAQLRRIMAPMGLPEKVRALNRVRRALNEISPFSEPVDLVQWIPSENVHAKESN